MDIKQFRETPLSNQIIKTLIETTEAICELKSLYAASVHKTMINKACLVNQTRYVNAYGNVDYSYYTIINALFSTNGIHIINIQTMNSESGKSHLKNCIESNNILFATAVLELNEAFNNNLDLQGLTIEMSVQMQNIHKEISEILFNLYNPNSEYPFTLEAVIAIYRLILISNRYEISTFVLDLLIQILFDLDFCFSISAQLIIQNKINTLSVESGINTILKMIKSEAKGSIDLIHTLNKRAVEIKSNLQENLPKLYSEKLYLAITQDLATCNDNFIKYMSISPKTAILYLKALEDKGFLRSYKIGREKIYVNDELLSCIKDNLGE